MNGYEQRQEDKAERARARAEKLAKESAAKFDQAHKTLDGIPPGQPILVDHYSAPRHRAALKRHDQRMRKAFELKGKAEHAAQRAKGIEGRSAIDSDDPNAPHKIREALEEMEAMRDRMKAVNAAWRKHKHPPATCPEGEDEAAWWAKWRAIGDSVAPPMSDHLIRVKLADMAQDWRTRPSPYESFELTNLGASIRRMRKRLEEVEALAVDDDAEEERREFGACVCIVDRAEGRVFFETPGRNEDATAILRGRGWRWARSRGCWSRKITANAIAAAREIGPKLADVYGGAS
jgi:hypothetical protein